MSPSSPRLPASASVPTLLAAVVLALAAAAAGVDDLAAQTVEVAKAQENLRQGPMGKRLATVNRGTRLRVVGRDGRWRQVVLEGWIWTPSVAPTDRGGHDLVVSADGGENLRSEPSARATVRARLLEGFLLTGLEESGDWTRVRRTAWMWAPSLRAVDGGDTADPDGGPEADRDPDGGGGAEETADSPTGGDEEAGADHRVVEGGPAQIHVSPDGDTIAVAGRGTDLTVLGRRGEWIRVRLDGWVRASDLVPPDSASAAREITPEQLRTHPDRYRGRRVRWTVQFISLERAEAARTDFYEGEPFLLARPAVREGTGFVYLAVPPEKLPRAERLRPLQEIHVLGRVRTGRSALMGAPVLDLLELHEAD